MTGYWPQPGQYRTVLAEWVRVMESPGFWRQVASTFCAWTRADPLLPRRLGHADTTQVRLHLAALLHLAAHDGHAPWVVAQTRDLHRYLRTRGVPMITDDTYRRLLVTLAAALRDHGVPRDIVEPYCAVFEGFAPSVTGEWEQRLHPYLRPSRGTRQLATSAMVAEFLKRTAA